MTKGLRAVDGAAQAGASMLACVATWRIGFQLV